MAETELSIKDIISKTKNFDQPYAPPIPEGICEVEVQSFTDSYSKDNHYRMLTLTVADSQDRTARITSMLELQWIDGTLRLIKGLYTHNAPEDEKEAAKKKINEFFDEAKDEASLQGKCIEVLSKLVEKGCTAWLRVERQNPEDQYADKALTAYEPGYRWKTADTAETITATGEGYDAKADLDAGLFNN